MIDRRARHRRVMILALASLAGAAWVSACGDDPVQPSPPPPPEPARPTSVTVEPSSATLTSLGETVVFRATVKDQRGAAFPGTVTWSSSDEAVFSVEASGTATAVANGSGTVTAAFQSLSATATVEVEQVAASLDVVSGGGQTADVENPLPEPVVVRVTDAGRSRVAEAAVVFTPGEGHGTADPAEVVTDGEGLARTVWTLGKTVGEQTLVATAGDVSETVLAHTVNPDRAALVALYNATDGPNWLHNDNWLTDAPLAEWYGVDTDASGRVVQLDLDARRNSDNGQWIPHGLKGSIPPELGALASLTELRLRGNNLTGPIPSELGALADLTWLDLRENNLTGPIPSELGNLTHLTHLLLNSNQLSGPIPPELGNLANLIDLFLGGNRLTGSIPSELGSLTNLIQLYLGTNDLTGPIPPELGGLGGLRVLTLESNSLSGPIPPEFGSLANLEHSNLRDNELAGPIPQDFLQLDQLSEFYFLGNALLCVPGTSAFATWLQGIESHDAEPGVFCNAADLVALKSLFEAAGGTGWIVSDGWLGDGAVEEWYGVSADSLGRVTGLDLSRNGLAGKLPPNLGTLARMNELRIGGNALSGRLPLSMTQLPLREFRYAGTELCVPTEGSFREWLTAIPSHEGTGVECAPPSDREILEALYESAGGPNWANNENWLTDSPLKDWFGIDVDGRDQVVRIVLRGNGLTGSIPAELGNLASLTALQLSGNALTGAIPVELGNLANLRQLYLARNQLSGPIPAELGDLASLTALGLESNALTGAIPVELGDLAHLELLLLDTNDLSGRIPPELGNLRSLTELRLGTNDLTGRIPPELGNLGSMSMLHLHENQLVGPVPPELGSLGSLTELRLFENRLVGSIPPELGSLSHLVLLQLDGNDLRGGVPPEFGELLRLRGLSLSHNPRLAGELPSDLTALRQLDALLAPGTGLCAPSDPGFRTWLEGIRNHRIADCTGDLPAAYLIQAAQSREFPVPLVAGEKALLRVFPTARQTTTAGLPAVRARFFLDGRETLVADIPGKSAPIPTKVDEGDLSKSANAEIPDEVVQPGLEMVIEIDPDGTLDPALGVATRIPETGRLAVKVRDMPRLDLTLIPFIWTERHDSSAVDLIRAMEADPENHDMLWHTRTLLPVGDLQVTAHEPVLTSTNDVFALLTETEAIRVMEAGSGYHAGMMPLPVSGSGGASGAAYLSGRSTFQSTSPVALAHELGHNMSLPHPACSYGILTDPSYPYVNGAIGGWGYDFRDGGSLVEPSTRDLMGGCIPGPPWISDYNFTNALRYRLFDEAAPKVAAAASSAPSLLLWGGVRADSVPYLEPAFVVSAPASLPESGGDYLLTGRTEGGTPLFSLAFDMPEVADGDGSSSFAFMLPARPEWEGRLASIVLTGPGGSAVLDRNTDRSMAILRNPRTGQVRGFLRVPSPSLTRAAADSAGSPASDLVVLLSRGIPDIGYW